MATEAHAYAAFASDKPLGPFQFQRRALRDDDVKIDIKYCGVCASDLHKTRNEWKNAIYPMVPATKSLALSGPLGPT